MKIYAINGSPRKGWNTETLLQKFLEGAASVSSDIEIKMVHLYDLKYKGCISCFACQLDNDAVNGKCQVKDDIYQLLREVPQADGVVFGSPIYFHDLSSGMRAFLERLVYQFTSFDKDGEGSNAPKKLQTAMIYTMNVTEEIMKASGYDHITGAMEEYIERTFQTKPVRIMAHDTYQFKDYSKYRVSFWDKSKKAEQRRTQFPLDCQAAYSAGKQMAEKILAENKHKISI